MSITELGLHHGTALLINVVRLTLWLGLLAAVFVPLERFLTVQGEGRGRRAIASDVFYYFLNSILPGLVIALPIATLAQASQAMLPAAYLGVVGGLPLWAKVVVALVVGEVGVYWGHRLCHEIPALWRFHAVHHAPEQMSWLVNTRAHPVDIVFTRLCGLAPIYLLGLQPAGGADAGALPMIVALVGTVWSFVVHANIRWRFGPLEYLLATPGFHHWHHTNDGNINKNYAAILPCMDVIFGTMFLPKHFPPSYGISEAHPPTVRGELIAPFRRRPAAGARPAAEDAAPAPADARPSAS